MTSFRFDNHQKSSWTILIRLLVGLAVFIPEGIQKLVFTDILSAGRFAQIGIPWPELMGPFVGIVEIVCGTLIVIGLAMRFATMPLIIAMFVAIITTKIPILLGHDFWLIQASTMAHEVRSDIAMLIGLFYLLINGAGRWSIDEMLERRKT